VFGEEFTIAWLVLIILMGEKVLQSLHNIFGRALMGVDRPDLAAYATIASVLVNLILNFILILQFGIIGAAVATTLSFTLNTFLHGHFLSKFVHINLPKSEIGWLVASSIGMFSVLKLIDMFVVINDILQLVSVILIGASIYGIIVILHPSIRKKITKWTLSFSFNPFDNHR
jgi:O-antigen/teichoic acid export membrane protein